jgi:hypothetical protein
VWFVVYSPKSTDFIARGSEPELELK